MMENVLGHMGAGAPIGAAIGGSIGGPPGALAGAAWIVTGKQLYVN